MCSCTFVYKWYAQTGIYTEGGEPQISATILMYAEKIYVKAIVELAIGRAHHPPLKDVLHSPIYYLPLLWQNIHVYLYKALTFAHIHMYMYMCYACMGTYMCIISSF